MRVTVPGNRSVLRQIATILAAVLILAPGLRDLVAAESAVAASGALNVSSDPPGATVYLDGRAAGETPIVLSKLTAGDHRVRLVKDGYLENARLVTVAAKKSADVRVTLTRTATAPTAAAAEQVSGGSSGGSSSKKWIIIGAAAGGGLAAALLLVNHNTAPDPGTIAPAPSTGTGMASITQYTFTSNATDKDNDSLTYTWNFGDGGSGSGASVTHTYAAPGTFNVSVSVSDGKASASPAGVTVTVGPNLAGAWRSSNGEPGFGSVVAVNLTQSGTTLGGTMTLTGNLASGAIPGAVSGTASSPLVHPNTVAFTSPSFTVPGNFPGQNFTIRFAGTSNAAGTVLTGTFTTTSTSLGTFTGATTFVR
jgi:PEGA domain-containing protein/PKD domain-containing protein